MSIVSGSKAFRSGESGFQNFGERTEGIKLNQRLEKI